MSTTGQRQASEHRLPTRPQGEQLTLVLPHTGASAPTARQLPPQLRLDARTRQVGRAGIAEIRRILAGSATDQAHQAA